MEKLTHCLTTSVPAEIVYPSIGQVVAEADHISSFLDLYRVRATDEAHLARVKSPTSCDPGVEPWAPLDALTQPAVPRRRRPTLRRSRSLSEIEHGIAITSDAVRGPGLRAATVEENHTTNIAGHPGPARPGPAAHTPLGAAQLAILTSDAARMAEFRRRFGRRGPVRLAAPPLPPPDAPLPSPPPPSALLKVKSPPPPALIAPKAVVTLPQPSAYVRLAVAPTTGGRAPLKSPRAPYWVKGVIKAPMPVIPKTPRTMRKERRQDRKSTRLNSSHSGESRMPSSA